MSDHKLFDEATFCFVRPSTDFIKLTWQLNSPELKLQLTTLCPPQTGELLENLIPQSAQSVKTHF